MILFIVNPVAGNGGAKAILPIIESYAAQHNLPHKIEYTTGVAHATELARAYIDSCDVIVAIGGDGTVRETAIALVGSSTALGVIACGTGNDLIKSLGIPKDPHEALQVISSGNARTIDTGTVNGKTVINVAGIGFDVDVVRNTLRYKKRYSGMRAYVMGILSTLLHIQLTHIRLTADDTSFECDTLITSVANGRIIGGGMLVAPRAELDDGLFDVCCVSNVPKILIPFLVPRFIKGTHISLKYCRYFKARQVDIEAAFPIEAQIDGELISLDRLDFRLLPASLNVLVPR